MASKKNNDVLLKAYQKVGLDVAFSEAIVAGGDAKHIIDTWKAKWRGDHGAEHPATPLECRIRKLTYFSPIYIYQ